MLKDLTKLLLLLLLSATAHAQTRYLTSSDFDSSKLRGWNFGTVNDFNMLKIKNIPYVRQTGANHARVWLQMNHVAGSYTYFYCNYKGVAIPSPIPVLDSLLKEAERNNLYIILCIEFFPNQAACDFWNDDARKNAIINVWKTLAARYKNRKIIAAYDLMNEPRINTAKIKRDAAGKITYQPTVKEYTEFQYSMITAIRTVDSSHAIVVEVLRNQTLGDWALHSDSTVFKNTLLKVKNLIYSPHGYSKAATTMQGIEYFTRKKYPDATTSPANTYDYHFTTNTYWTEPAYFKKKYNVPIWVGEFACINWAPKNSLGEWTSTRWMGDAAAYMDSVQFSWAAHAWREYQGWDAEVPSSWYEGKTFVNGKPTSLPGASVRSATAPTLVILKQKFLMNKPF